MIPATRHLEYAAGFLALGMLDEASAELDLIDGEERNSDAARLLRFEISVLRRRKFAEVERGELLRMWREVSAMG